MKKSILLLSVLLSALAITSCRSNPGSRKNAYSAPVRRDLPDFFLSPPAPESDFVGLGMARLSDDNLSRTASLARARADIAAQVAVSVESMLTDYAQDSGVDGNVQTINFVERISKEVANIELKGAVTQEQYPARDGTWYTMVYFPKNALLEDVGQIFQRNEDAAFAEFKAQQALERLNAEVANNPPKSAGAESPVNE